MIWLTGCSVAAQPSDSPKKGDPTVVHGKVIKLALVLVSLLSVTPLLGVDYGGPHRPYSEDLQNYLQNYSGNVDDFTEADLAAMSFDDVRLKNVYFMVFSSMMSDRHLASTRPGVVAAYADLQRRGDTAVPMLLKMMADNQETRVETSILANITEFPMIQVDPFLEYSRTVLRERTQTMNAVLAACASGLLAQRGGAEDAKLMEWVIKQRPFIAETVTSKLEFLNHRLAGGVIPPRPSREETTEAAQSQPLQKTPSDLGKASDPSKESEPSHWYLHALLVAAITALIWGALTLWRRKSIPIR